VNGRAADRAPTQGIRTLLLDPIVRVMKLPFGTESVGGARARTTSGRPSVRLRSLAPYLVTAIGFLAVFNEPLRRVADRWWDDPDFGHGLLLAPVAVYLMWKRGVVPGAHGQRALGLTLLVLSVLLRYLTQVAPYNLIEVFTLMGAVVALTVFYFGLRQLAHWWLPMSLLLLCMPFDTSALSLPLQLIASRLGAGLFQWWQVPVMLSGNIIHLPGRDLFVTEACSGLRSITALLALGVLIGGLFLNSPWNRLLIVVLAIPVAVLVNALRVFMTGFLILFVDPRWADGFMHASEGWLMFVLAFGVLGGIAWVITQVEGLGRIQS
jgi:exosortase